ncbi:HPr family phosphocarrier protein [Cellulomonas sp. KRMCY2]|uniref:HPr family phosphocarrier protein n=1 Tax=Cellulomonas sp. KRMCY2 TaxID=1304865 RepID=UPI00045EA9F9|nr:HPr family phosphocarrier protein [Cellulomonas sp. KRMCY2]
MPLRTVVVASQVGLHARPAAVFTTAVIGSGLPVTVGRPGSAPVDAQSILAVMGLAVKHGETVELAASGSDADRVLDELVGLLEQDLDAE